MKKVLFFLVVFTCVAASNVQSQFLKKLKAKAENSANNAIGNRVDKEMNKAADKDVPRKDKSRKSSDSANSEPGNDDQSSTTAQQINNSSASTSGVQDYSKYDFVAGEEILIADDFSQDEIGEFPGLWNTNGKGEVVRIGDGDEKWFKMFQQSVYSSPNSKTLPESFTVEFDAIFDMKNKGWIYPEIQIVLLNTGDNKPSDNAVFKHLNKTASSTVTIQLGEYNNTGTEFSTYQNGKQIDKTPFKRFKTLEGLYGKPIHFAISVHKQRFRLWINEEKVYDLPKAIDATFNQFVFGISGSNYSDEQLKFYFRDFKIAGGLPDTKSKLLTEGKLVSTAIRFDVNSDRIKPASAGAIKEIAEVLKANPSVKISITGHTDSDGEEAANRVLSVRRAAAVRKALVDQHGIDAARIEKVDGKGEEEPVADNKTAEGKARNRRVEFVKL